MTSVDMLSPSPQNRSNFAAHFTGTGPEIWRQTNGEIAAFVAGAGRYIAVPLWEAI
jgi:cysteine synthase